jgi:PAS domain S-box-containing protein
LVIMMRSPWLRALLALAIVSLSLLVSAIVFPDDRVLFSVLLLSVLISAWYGGLLIGLTATVLGVVGSVAVPWALLGSDVVPAVTLPRLIVFAVVGAIVSAFADRRRRQQLQLQELQLQHARLAEVMHSIGIGHWYSDLPTQQMYWDTQCKAHYGLSPDAEITLDRFLECVHSDDRERVQSENERAVFSHTSCDVDYRVVHPDGQVRWLKALGRGFYDQHGHPTRFDGITVDITPQKAAEQTLSDANRMKDEFLGALSHELRTPLNAVLGWARLLATGGLPPHRVPHAISVIERNAQVQARLVEDLLDLSSIVTGRLRLRVEPLDLGAVALSALDAVRPAADARQVHLLTNIDPSARWVAGDPDRLRQIVWNLLSNGVKFTPAGGQVTLSITPHRSGVNLIVRDTGRGIDQQFLPRVFERFSQAEGEEVRGVRGLGIGLAIVHELVEAHGGTVAAASPGLGLGATFTVSLPNRLAETTSRPAAGEAVR